MVEIKVKNLFEVYTKLEQNQSAKASFEIFKAKLFIALIFSKCELIIEIPEDKEEDFKKFVTT